MAKKKDADYTVGYRKPPEHSQFKPGQSGNPAGRPRKTKSIVDAFSKLARKVVTVPTTRGNKRMSMIDVVANKHFGMAANGNHKSTEIVLKILTPAEANRDSNIDDLVLEFRERSARIEKEDPIPGKAAENADSIIPKTSRATKG